VLLLRTSLHIISIVERSLVPVIDLVDGDLRTLPDNLAGVLRKLLQVVQVAGLARDGGQRFVPNDILLLIVFDALPQKLLLLALTKPDLSQYEADLVLKERWLTFIVLEREKLA